MVDILFPKTFIFLYVVSKADKSFNRVHGEIYLIIF